MIRSSAIINTDIIDAFAETAKQAPRAVKAFVEGTIRREAERLLLTPLRKEPGPPKYPLAWESERQRRAFFATNGFGAGIPYPRTGRLIAAWRIEAKMSLSEGLVSVVNDSPSASFVQGMFQQRFHRITGWANVDDVTLSASEKLDDMLVDGWYSITEPGSGIKFT